LPPNQPIILASASPRRQELLKNAGIAFELWPANIPEVPHAGEGPVVFAERMAQEKARVVSAPLAGRIILAADTVVALGNEILGKPANPEDAARMLRLLSGRTHAVTSGVCLIGERREDVRSETTFVEFSRMTEAEISDYVSTGEPMDKAGAYAIQGGASRWITRVDGDYNNVVGLPVELVLRMLKDLNTF
jgi:nucleoside triphosphate pyrophosphatase